MDSRSLWPLPATQELGTEAEYDPHLRAPRNGAVAHPKGSTSGAAWQSDGVTKTQYYTATSLDGYIADEHNSLDWLFEVDRAEGDDHSFTRFFADVGAMAMGATTYEWVLDHDHLLDHPEKWHAYYGETPCWVFTHRRLSRVPGADIRFVQGDVRPVTGR